MLKKIDIEILNEYISKGLIITNNHPTLPLMILNYSRKCQFEGAWDEYTISCRGLIIDFDGTIIGRPFLKFKNYEEYKPEEIPNLPFEVFTKMDGSLGIMFNYNDEWHIATRGSFVSDQAIKAKEILKNYDISKLNKENTYLFEIIY